MDEVQNHGAFGLSFSFWRRWLLAVSIYLVLFGLLLAFFNESSWMNTLVFQYYDPIFWPDNRIAAGTIQYKAWSSSVLGAVMAGWGLMIAFIAYVPFNRREKWAWSCITATISLWFVVDSSFSLYYRVPVNVVFNLFTLLLFAVPLLFTFNHFFGRTGA